MDITYVPLIHTYLGTLQNIAEQQVDWSAEPGESNPGTIPKYLAR